MSIKENAKKLLLIDGNGLAYRSFYAVPLYQSALGLPINAVLGFANLLLNAIVAEKPSHVVVAFDHCALTEKLQKYQSYNVQREEMPDELAIQLPRVEDIVGACGLVACRIPGFEADDLLGTLAKRAQNDGFQTLIVSGDLELLQLVSPGIRVLTTRRGIADAVIYDEELVHKKYNLYPNQLADLRALAGDSSQNIGGVPGVGEVTARRLLSQFNNLDELYDSLEQLPAKWRNPLSENRENAMEFRARATIRTDLPVRLDWDDCCFKGVPVDRIKRILGKVDAVGDFKFLLDRMSSVACDEASPEPPEQAVSREEALERMQALVADTGDFSLAILRDGEQEVGAAIKGAGGEAFYLNLGEGENAVAVEQFWQIIGPLFDDASRIKYVYQWRDCFNRHKLGSAGVFDVGVASGLTDPSCWDHSLEAICSRYGLVACDHQVMFGVPARPANEVPESNRVCFAVVTAAVLHQLGSRLRARLREEGVEELYWNVDLPMSLVMGALDWQGLSFSPEGIVQLEEVIEAQLDSLRKQIILESPKPFDIDNDKELGEFLFEHLGLLIPTRPKSGGTIGPEVLVSLVGQHPVAAIVRDYRELSEYRRVFVRGFLGQGQADDIVGGSLFNPALAAERHLRAMGKPSVTGVTAAMHRCLAVTNNLLSTCVRGKLSAVLQESLVAAAPERYLALVSFEQLCLRVLAHLAGDQALLEYVEHHDFEAELASILFNVPVDSVAYDMRITASQMVVSYMGPEWLARRLDCSEAEVQERSAAFAAVFAAKFPASWRYMEPVLHLAQEQRNLESIAGRRRRILEAGSRNHDIRECAHRLARGAAVEGSCADIVRRSVVELASELGKDTVMMPLFDQIIMELPRQEPGELSARVLDVVSKCTYGVPVKVHVAVGENWRQAIEALEANQQ